MKKLTSILLGVALVATLLTGCGSAQTSSGSSSTATETSSAAGKKVGVSMPTKDLQRWNQDGSNMEKELKAAGYEVELQFANNDPQTQLSQIETMISNGCSVLVIAAVEGNSLGEALDMAKAANVPVIAYDLRCSFLLCNLR